MTKNFGLGGPSGLHIVGDKINEGISVLNTQEYGYIYDAKTKRIIFNKNSAKALNNKHYLNIGDHVAVRREWCDPEPVKKQVNTEKRSQREYLQGIDFEKGIPF